MSDPTAPADGRCTFILYSGTLQWHQRSVWWIRGDERDCMFYKMTSDSFSWLEIALSLLTVVSLPPWSGAGRCGKW